MRRMIASIAALALVEMPGASLAQPGASPVPLTPAAMALHTKELVAQCPPPPPVVEGAATAKLPIHVTHWGDSGTMVLLVHGGVQGKVGGGPATFDRQEVLAKRGWQLTRVDRPGFGGSLSRGPDSQQADSVWVAEMLGKGSHLIGHSFGGADSLLAAARRPEAVRSLILIEPGLQSLLADYPDLTADPRVKADAAGRARMLMAARTPGDYGVALAHSLEPDAGSGNASSNASAEVDADAGRAMAMGCSLLRSVPTPPEAFRAAAATIAQAGIPVLVVTGGWSLSIDAVGEAVARATHGRHIIVRSPNHYVMLASADAFNAAADAFMREADAAHRR